MYYTISVMSTAVREMAEVTMYYERLEECMPSHLYRAAMACLLVYGDEMDIYKVGNSHGRTLVWQK